MLHMRHIMCHKKGVSTILGTLIFIGILFSAVIPMMLTMKQADIYMEREKLEMQRIDDERSREDLDVYAYPEGSDKIQVLVLSRCEVPATIVHVWIMESTAGVDYINMNQTSVVVDTMDDEVIGNYSVNLTPDVNSTFRVKVTTSRGNVFENLAGDIKYDGTTWMTEEQGIYVIIDSEGGGFWGFGRYRCTVNNDDTYSVTKESSITFGSCSFYFNTTKIGPDEFHVKVEKKTGFFFGTWKIVYEEDVEITWPNGPPVVWVFTT